MIDNIIIAESKSFHNFFPFSVLHPIWDLRVGALKIYERYFEEFSNSNISFCGRFDQLNTFLVRNKIKNKFGKKGNCLVFNSNIVLEDSFLFKIEKLAKDN